MTDSAASTDSDFHGTAPVSPGRNYTLSDDLARCCLPQEFKDSYRTLAWVNSVCALFLAVGMVGLKAPRVIEKPLSELTDPVPVVFTPPPEPPKPTAERVPDEPEQVTDAPVDTPQVVTIVAAADSADVAFAVPVQGAVALAPTARFAPPPPAAPPKAPSAPVRFNPATANDGGSYPPPSYPGIALRNRYQGTVQIYILVDPDGKVMEAKVQKSAGYPSLDDAALDVVKNRWRFPPGQTRYLIWPCVFQMQ